MFQRDYCQVEEKENLKGRIWEFVENYYFNSMQDLIVLYLKINICILQVLIISSSYYLLVRVISMKLNLLICLIYVFYKDDV